MYDCSPAACVRRYHSSAGQRGAAPTPYRASRRASPSPPRAADCASDPRRGCPERPPPTSPPHRSASTPCRHSPRVQRAEYAPPAAPFRDCCPSYIPPVKRLLGEEPALIRSLLFLYPCGGLLNRPPIRDQRVIRIGFLRPAPPLRRLEQTIGECACFLCVL